RPDGIIARVGCRTYGRQLHRLGRPVVNLCHEDWGREFPKVIGDGKEIIRWAVGPADGMM
ncbi:MAG: hypothetical protein ACLP7W_02560, partial [Solirubrobacteraceae bacterium]